MAPRVVSKEFLSPGFDVTIGRFVLEPESPHHHFFPSALNAPDPTIGPMPDAPVASTPMVSYSEVISAEKKAGIRAALVRVGKFALAEAGQEETKIQSLCCMTYRLNNAGEWYDLMIGREDSRKWLQRMIVERGVKVYLVVGYRTLFNASVARAAMRERSGEAKLEVPLPEAVCESLAAAQEIMGALKGDSSLGLSASYKSTQGEQKSYRVPGEQVYAIEYRQIKFKWFSKKNMDASMLASQSRWEVRYETRGKEADEDNVVEAEMVDSMEDDEEFFLHDQSSDGDQVYFSEDEDGEEESEDV